MSVDSGTTGPIRETGVCEVAGAMAETEVGSNNTKQAPYIRVELVDGTIADFDTSNWCRDAAQFSATSPNAMYTHRKLCQQVQNMHSYKEHMLAMQARIEARTDTAIPFCEDLGQGVCNNNSGFILYGSGKQCSNGDRPVTAGEPPTEIAQSKQRESLILRVTRIWNHLFPSKAVKVIKDETTQDGCSGGQEIQGNTGPNE